MFTADSEHQIGARRIPNEEVADAARENADMMIAFASIDFFTAATPASAPACRAAAGCV